MWELFFAVCAMPPIDDYHLKNICQIDQLFMLVLSFENVSFDPELPDGMMLAKVRGGQELS